MNDPSRGSKHPRADRQLACDILLDLVDDALASKVVQPGRAGKSPKPKAVLDKLEQTFGTACATMHSLLRSSIQELKQAPGETAAAYMLRAENLFDRLRTAGGSMSSKTFLQALKEGVLPRFRLTVKLFERDKVQTVALLAGALQAEESSLARQETLRGSGSTLQDVNLALQQVAMPDELRSSIQNTVMVLTNGGDNQKWTPKQAAGGKSKGRTIRDPVRYAALEATSICYNCGVLGHRARNCKLPQSKPYKFTPNGKAAGQKPAGAGASAPPSVVA
jgi:hypothetical protein